MKCHAASQGMSSLHEPVNEQNNLVRMMLHWLASWGCFVSIQLVAGCPLRTVGMCVLFWQDFPRSQKGEQAKQLPHGSVAFCWRSFSSLFPRFPQQTTRGKQFLILGSPPFLSGPLPPCPPRLPRFQGLPKSQQNSRVSYRFRRR